MLEGIEPFVRSTGGHSLGLITNRDYNVPFYEKNGYKQCGYKVLTYENTQTRQLAFCQIT